MASHKEVSPVARFVVHKKEGTTRVVTVEADAFEFEPSGVLSFWVKQRLVMAYAPTAWKTVYQEVSPDE